MICYKLYHAYVLDGRREKKNIGIYSSPGAAQDAVAELRGKRGFERHPDGFVIKRVLRLIKPRLVDRTFWADGFTTYDFKR